MESIWKCFEVFDSKPERAHRVFELQRYAKKKHLTLKYELKQNDRDVVLYYQFFENKEESQYK
tara:strand:- start:13850 stop:14038 length:189 start_codon:yes stop_codon:yes gene_type:complete